MSKQLLLTLTTIALLYGQSNSFFTDSKRGWHYYEKEPLEEEVKKGEKQEDKDQIFMQSIPLNSLDTLSVKEYTETFERVKSIATMKPTKENIKIFL